MIVETNRSIGIKKFRITVNDKTFESIVDESQVEFRDRIFAAIVKK